MKIMKRKMYGLFFIFLMGIGFISVSFYSHTNDTLRSMGIGFCVIFLLKLIQYYRIFKDPAKIKQLELIQGEERIIFIANKSMATTFYLSIFVEYIAMAIFLLFGKNDITTTICYITALQAFAYLACHMYFSKKY